MTRLGAILRRAGASNDGVDLLRGAEGDAAQVYFGVFDDLIRASDPEIRFRGRSRRPPLDPVNALLSFLYTLLTHDCRGAAECVGLDPAVGFLHWDRPGRSSLVLDLMEELRPALADRLALALFNRRQLRIKDFATQDNGVVLLTDEGRTCRDFGQRVQFSKSRWIRRSGHCSSRGLSELSTRSTIACVTTISAPIGNGASNMSGQAHGRSQWAPLFDSATRDRQCRSVSNARTTSPPRNPVRSAQRVYH